MNDKVMYYGKFIIGAIGAAATACLGLIPESSTTWTIITIIAAVATALGVFFAPYVTPPPAQEPEATPIGAPQ